MRSPLKKTTGSGEKNKGWKWTGAAKWTPHDLRHVAACWMLFDLGLEPPVVAESSATATRPSPSAATSASAATPNKPPPSPPTRGDRRRAFAWVGVPRSRIRSSSSVGGQRDLPGGGHLGLPADGYVLTLRDLRCSTAGSREAPSTGTSGRCLRAVPVSVDPSRAKFLPYLITSSGGTR